MILLNHANDNADDFYNENNNQEDLSNVVGFGSFLFCLPPFSSDMYSSSGEIIGGVGKDSNRYRDGRDECA